MPANEPSTRLTRGLATRAFGATAFIAIVSYWWQFPGLAGVHGVAPIAPVVAQFAASELSFFDVPTLLRVWPTDTMVHLLLGAATLACVALMLGRFTRLALFVLWASWLSVVTVGAPFLSFQWDLLLVESTVCFFVYASEEPSRAGRFLMACLACKVTLESGIVKLASGDPTWRDLTALTFHWWTQPLPTWSSVLANALPVRAQQLLCGVMFVLELPIPLLALGPRKARLVAALGMMAMQVGLFVAGNYSYYNVLTFVLALPLLDDAVLRRVLPLRVTLPTVPLSRVPRGNFAQWSFVALFVVVSASTFSGRVGQGRFVEALLEKLQPFASINAYGAFAVMTKTRDEIVLEGSVDGVNWEPYEFPFKPGRVDRRPTFIAPWQPRLDWQMWFASLGSCRQNPWVLTLQQRLLEGRPEVLALFEVTPTPPPKFLRTTFWEYRFAPLAQHGVWWTRVQKGEYCPAVQIDSNGQLQRAQTESPRVRSLE